MCAMSNADRQRRHRERRDAAAAEAAALRKRVEELEAEVERLRSVSPSANVDLGALYKLYALYATYDHDVPGDPRADTDRLIDDIAGRFPALSEAFKEKAPLNSGKRAPRGGWPWRQAPNFADLKPAEAEAVRLLWALRNID